MKESPTDRSVSLAVLQQLTVLIVLAVLFGAKDAKGADPDLQLWFPVQFIHPFSEKLSVSMQTEVRLQNDISDFSELVYKPALNFHFTET